MKSFLVRQSFNSCEILVLSHAVNISAQKVMANLPVKRYFLIVLADFI